SGRSGSRRGCCPACDQPGTAPGGPRNGRGGPATRPSRTPSPPLPRPPRPRRAPDESGPTTFAPAMAVFLVRHAIALGRSDWDGDDIDRPLTKRGERQAVGLVDLLKDHDIRRACSSPAVRCVHTVVPLATKLG